MITGTLKTEERVTALGIGVLASIVALSFCVRTWYLLPIAVAASGVGLAALVTLVRLPVLLYSVFVLVAWFPEFSQTEWDVHTAKEAPSLYNFPPIPGITASVFDYFFAAIVLVWLVKFVLLNPRKLLKVPFAKPMLVFLGVWVLNFLHGLWRGNEAYYALREFRVGAYFVLAYFMVVTTCGEIREIRQFLKVSVSIAAVIGVYGVFRFALGMGKEFGDIRIVYYDIADSMVLYIAMILIASFSIGGLIGGSKRWLLLVLAFPMVFSFLFSYRRGAWVAFSVALLFLVFTYPGRARLRRRVFWRLSLSATLFAALVVAIPAVRNIGLSFVLERLQSIFDITDDSSNVFRILDAQNAFNAFMQHPVIGVGAGGRYDIEFASKEPVLMEFMEEVNRTSHDGYLYVLFKTGIIGFLVYMFVFASFLKAWFRMRKKIAIPIERAVHMAIGAIVIAFLMNNVTEPVSDTLRPSLLLSFVVAWGAVWMREISNRGQSEPYWPAEQINSRNA